MTKQDTVKLPVEMRIIMGITRKGMDADITLMC